MAELRVSTRPAFFTAVTRVDSTGLLDAAVATGSVDMPLKLPLPDAGTAEQPGPNGWSADGELLAMVGAELAGAAAVLPSESSPLEQAAAAVATAAAARTPAAMRVRYMVNSLLGFPMCLVLWG
ncbi:hypothetical protein GCM10022254_17890 [Actinomadura meridiana]|uniref:Uncharacterized protein n=1 Tax=Actinomadura meridiana TaxID=559626 RepID=A0ABP8BW55_9ACTN